MYNNSSPSSFPVGKLPSAIAFLIYAIASYVRNSAEFYAAVEQRGIGRRKKSEGRFVTGVRLTESDFI